MFEQEILTQLKTKYKNLGLSETILKAKAKQLSKAVEKQEDIENAVAGVEDDLAIFQSFADQNRTLAKKIEELEKGKSLDPKPADPVDPKPADPKPAPTGGTDEAVLKLLQEMKEELTSFKTEKAQQTTAQQLQAKFTELKIPQSFQKLIPMDKVFATPEEMEAFVNEQKANYDGIAQEFGNAALSNMGKPTLFSESVKEGEITNAMQAYKDSKKPKDNEQH